jgi:hypothetical protein
MTNQLLAVVLWGLLTGQAPAPTSNPPALQLIPEPIADFATAYRDALHQDPDAAHLDPTKYHAYRYFTKGHVIIGMARWVLVDSAGHINLFSEPHTTAHGGIDKTFQRYSHIMLPIDVNPITVDHPCFTERQDVPNSHIMTPSGDCPTPPPLAP